MRKLNFGLIGCGRVSKNHIMALVENKEDAALKAVCDITPSKAEGRKALYLENMKDVKNEDIKVYTDYKKLLSDQSIDVVSIATYSGEHAHIAIEALEAGKNVIVEKPIALSVSDAQKMIDTAKKCARKLTVCHQNRFNSTVQELRRALEKGRFGKLITGVANIRWNRNDGYYSEASWRGTWEEDGGTLMNQCIHDIDLLQWMMGPVESVYGQTGTFLRHIDAEDMGAGLLRFKNGAIGIIEGSACVYPKNLEETLTLFGEKGTVRIGGVAVNQISDWKFGDGIDTEEEIKNKVNYGDPDSVYGYGHSPLYNDFIHAVNENRDPYINPEEGKKAMEIVLAIYKSKKTGEAVYFPLEDFSTLDMRTSR